MIGHVAVIGGGVAGLAAATRLAEAGVRVTVLEAAPIAGGRARSWIDPATGDVVDNGQHLLMGCYRETLAFLERIGARSDIQFQDRLQVVFADAAGESGAIDCPPLPGPLSLLHGLSFHRGLRIADRIGILRAVRDIARRAAEDDPAAARGGAARPTDTSRSAKAETDPDHPREADSGDRGRGVETSGDESAGAYLDRLRQTPRARRAFWDPLIIAALNDRPDVVSALTFRRVVRIGLLASPAEARLGWAKVGLGDLYAPASARYLAARGGCLRTSAPAASVFSHASPASREAASDTWISAASAHTETHDDRPGSPPTGSGSDRTAPSGGITVVLRSGERVEADAVVVAVTPSALARLLPSDLAGSPPILDAARLAPSPILGVNLWFDRPIVAAGFVGLLGTTMQWLFNKRAMLTAGSGGAAARHDRPPGYVALVVSGARREIERAQDDLIATALADLRALFPAARGAKLLHALVVKEREATVSPAPGWDALRPGPRTSDPAIFLAGDWTATGLPATIESAALSGHRAAEVLLARP